MNTKKRHREVCYRVEDGCLARTVTRRDGRGYERRCLLETYKVVAHAVEETQGEGTTLQRIASAEDLPFTHVNVSPKLPKERGMVQVRGRRCYPGTRSVQLDAMVQFHARLEGPDLKP